MAAASLIFTTRLDVALCKKEDVYLFRSHESYCMIFFEEMKKGNSLVVELVADH